MLVGQSWTWIQVISPLLSLKGVAYRFIVRPIVEEDDIFVYRLFTALSNICCILPMLIFILSMFTYSDERPEWAKQFNTVRLGFRNGTYPDIVNTTAQGSQ